MVTALVVHSNPCNPSLGSALRDTAVGALGDAGYSVDLLDLYAEQFDPVEPRPSTGSTAAGSGSDTQQLADYIARLRACKLLVLVYPTWWGAQPAMLTGWLDRVWRDPDAVAPTGRLLPNKTVFGNIERVVVITTHGSPRWINALQGESGKRLLQRGMRRAVGSHCKVDWVALYDLDHVRPGQTDAFIGRVREHLARIA
jgi:hypothetical protein